MSAELVTEPVLAPLAADELAATLAHYRAEGWARVPRRLHPERLAALRARAEALMLGEVVHPGMFFQADTTSGRYDDLTYGRGWIGPSLNYRKLEKLELDPLFRALVGEPLCGQLAQALLGAVPITLYRAVLMNKAAAPAAACGPGPDATARAPAVDPAAAADDTAERPVGGTVLPWHQDGGRMWGIDREPELQVWIALDDAPAAAGCVEVLPGSHRQGLATPLGGLVPPDLVAAADAETRALPLPAEAGDVLLIHNHLWHRSGVNRTPFPRRAVTVCYMHGATRCTRRRRAPRRFLEVFAAGPAGAAGTAAGVGPSSIP